MHDKGYSAAEVFDSLRAEFGVRDIWEVDDLTGLAEYSLTARRDDDDDEDE